MNKIPDSYKKLIKNLGFQSVKKTNLCSSCLMDACLCQNNTNLDAKKLEIFEFDIENQISCIVRKNWDIMCNYKSTNSLLTIFLYTLI